METKAQIARLMEEFDDLFDQETRLISACRYEKNKGKGLELELEVVSDKVENLRERIATLSVDHFTTDES